MNAKRRELNLAALLAVLLVLAASGCSRGTSSKLRGTWVKKSGDPSMPAEITLKQADRRFRMSYYESGGLETVTLLCDGLDHPLSPLPVKMTYSAELYPSKLIVTKHITSIFNSPTQEVATQEVAYAEQWSVSEDGHRLIVTANGTETTFERRPFLSSLFTSAP
jgi:hypothetical protein